MMRRLNSSSAPSPSPDGERPQERPASTDARRRERWALAGILATAFGLRLAWVFVMDPHQMRPVNWDSVWYLMRAHGLAEGKGYLGHHGQPTAFFAPGYPALLALLTTFFGDAPIVPKLFNVAASTLTCLFVFLIGKRAFGSGVGLLGALLMALCPGDIAFTGLQLSELSFVCFFTGAILVFFPRRPPLDGRSSLRSWLFGLALGIAGLVRGIGLPFLPVALAVSLYARGLTRDSLMKTALVCVGLLVAVGPWMVRNAVVMNAPGMITADGPLALLMAHSPISSGTHVLGMQDWRKEQLAEYAELPYPEREVEEARAMLRLALRHALTHPLWELSMVPRRLYHFVEHDRWAFSLYLKKRQRDASPEELARLAARKKRLDALAPFANAYFYALLALGLLGGAGVVVRVRGGGLERSSLLVPGVVAYYLFAHSVVFYGSTRYHAPMVPQLALLAAFACLRIAGPLVRSRRPS